MRSLTLLVLLCSTGLSIAQTLTTVTAVGGGKKTINWPAIQKAEDADKDGPGFFYRDCSQGVEVVSASSELKPQGTKTYGVSQLADNNPMTAWVEGKAGYGIGESFSVKAPRVNSIFNGYQASPSTWINNSRVKKFKVYVDSKPLCYLALTDDMGEQTFELPLESTDDKSHVFKFEIVDVYKGVKWDDVAISHIDNNGCCVVSGTFVELPGEQSLPINDIGKHTGILGLDIESGHTFVTESSHVAQQMHLSILEVSTSGHVIEITPDHPVWIKDKGFTSLARIKTANSEYEQLKGIEIMVWNSAEKRTSFEKVIDIKKKSGQFQTYTVKGIPAGTVYIANGFVTRSY